VTAFRVLLEGRHHQILFENKLQDVGFYVTRFIEAASEGEARKGAIGSVQAELERTTIKSATVRATLVVETCEPLAPDEEAPEVQPGVVWFREDGREGED